MTFSKEELEFLYGYITPSQHPMTVQLHNKIKETLDKIGDYNLCLWKFYWDCGRQGEVEGFFKATKKQVENIQGEEIYFGEILGKHSEVYGSVDDGDITLISDDPLFVLEYIESGDDPFNYWYCSECGNGYIIDPDTKICEECGEEAL